MSNESEVQVGRLAMRHEGDYWNAYYAPITGMKGAVFLGSIRMEAIRSDNALKVSFMELMRKVVSEIIDNTLGVRPTWGEPTEAPEHEKAGHS